MRFQALDVVFSSLQDRSSEELPDLFIRLALLAYPKLETNYSYQNADSGNHQTPAPVPFDLGHYLRHHTYQHTNEHEK
jgi:hypothetical protein